jgi:hypothetical protein
VLLDHRAQRRQDGRQTLAPRDELGVEQLFGRVVHHGDERLPGVGDQGQSRVPAAIEVQQFPVAGAPARGGGDAARAGAACRPSRRSVRQAHAMVAASHLVDVPDVEGWVAVARA